MTYEDRLDDILDAWQLAFERGADLPAADLCKGHPDVIPEIERRIAVLRKGLAVFAGTSLGSKTDCDTPVPLPTALGEYSVIGLLGTGGMGEVYRAKDSRLNREVAVKVMRPLLSADPNARSRFLREARAAAALQHDNVVQIHHVGEENGAPFIVMPLLEGESLENRLQRGPLSPPEVVRVGREAALGLAAAHAKGMIHRDVKPANLWLEAPGGRIKVLDFGLARAVDGTDKLTLSGGVVGSAPYMAPEQADGRPVDTRADVFSLGAVLYEAATGRRAFDGTTLTAILRAVAERAPEPPHGINPAVPVPLSNFIMQMLEKDPAGRPTSAQVVAHQLATLLEGGSTPAPWRTTNRLDRRSRRPLSLLIGIVVLLVGITAWQVVRDPGMGSDQTVTNRPQSSVDDTGARVETTPRITPVKYRGSIDLYVYRKDDTNSDRLFPLRDPRAMPLKPGDQLQLVVEVDPPAFLYVFWIDETGNGIPAYPWRFSEWGTRHVSEKQIGKVDIRWPGGEALRIEGPNAGTETVLMLARPTRLEASDAEVQKWFTALSPVPFQGPKAKVWFEDYDVLRHDPDRSPGVSDTQLDGPRGLQAILRKRIGTEVGNSWAISFSRMGAE